MEYNIAVNKIMPIICIIFSALCTTASVCAMILMGIAANVAQIAVVAIPFTLAAAALSLACGTVTAFFRKSKACKVAFYIDLFSFVLAVIAIIVWLAVL